MIVEGTTARLAEYLKENEVNLSKLSKKTGIPYSQLYNSIGNKKRIRELGADEFLSICKAIRVSAKRFI